jgi:lipoprotein-releasing system permease protein
VFVGVMALIVVTSVMTGLQRDLRDKILGTNPHIWLTTYGETHADRGLADALARVEAVPGCRGGRSLRARGGRARNAGRLRGGRDPARDRPGRRGTAGHRHRAADPRGRPLALGETQSGLPPLLIGDALADRFGLYPGSVVNVISLQGAQVTRWAG